MNEKNTNACTRGTCQQGRNCDCCPNSYKANFDHLGNQVDQTQPFRISDLIIIAIAVLGTVALLSGVI